ncbi:MAG: nicotinate-nucleotide adenylyltransferase [Rugosibacter sp.]|nr:nicotinate-nucleotide adenylyltransferase [Rugosibacter sp.]
MSETPGVLGVYGGTFDPPHIAHLRLAIEAREMLGLSEVAFVPAGQPPLRAAPQASPVQRLAMVERAIAATPGLRLDAAEAMSSGPSYTVATLERLRAHHGPQRPLVLLLGADAFTRLEAWQRWRELFALAHIGVATRPGHALAEWKVGAGDTPLQREFLARQGVAADLANAPAGRIVPFAMTALEISATAIRARLAAGRNVRHLAPDAVLDYIDSNTLYRTPNGR